MTEKRSQKEMYELVERWTKEIDIFELDFLFIPVNIGSHWSLSVIVRPGLILNSSTDSQSPNDIDKPCILFMDSLDLHSMMTISKQLRSYVENEWNVKKLKLDINTLKRQVGVDPGNGQMILSTNNLPVVKCHVPQQPNGTDCGVYVVRFIKLILDIWPRTYQADIEDRMKRYINRDSFLHDEIVNIRLEIKETIISMKGTNNLKNHNNRLIIIFITDEFDLSRLVLQQRKMKERRERREQKRLNQAQPNNVSTAGNTESKDCTVGSNEINNDNNAKDISSSDVTENNRIDINDNTKAELTDDDDDTDSVDNNIEYSNKHNDDINDCNDDIDNDNESYCENG
jgi:sentrin-specific protease 7